jgi:ankyrin repeat protein
LLRAHGAEIDIFTAAALGDVRTVRRMLAETPSLVSREGPDGGMPLHFAASASVAKALMDAGADPQQPDRFHKQTPVQWAHNRPDVLAVLLGEDAKQDIHVAAAIGNLRTVKALVRAQPDLVKARIAKPRPIVGAKGDTPLAVAAYYGQDQIVEWLLANGAEATATPSVLPQAVLTGKRTIVASLIEAGADPNAFDAQGHAALHIAAAAGNVAMIRQLLAAKAKVHLKDKEHDSTPLAWAVYHQKARAVEYLRRHGAI